MKIKVLQIVPSLSLANGVAAYLENYYSFMNLQDFQTTILVLNDDEKGRYNFFKEKKCKIVEIFKDESLIKYLSEIDNFFKNNKFDIVHCHSANYGAFYMYYARKYNVKCRVLHSHANRSADGLFRAIRNSFLIPLAVKFSNYYVACSIDAGDFMFKKKKYEILVNGIDYNKYYFNENIRNLYRKKMNISDKFVIGSFGRLCNQKNQLFTLEIFKNVIKIIPNAHLILVGDGYLKNKIEKRIDQLNLKGCITLFSSRSDLNSLYNALDIFLLPSTYEGLGIVLIESQVNGLKTFTSKFCVPNEAKISDLLEYLDLNDNPMDWANKIIESYDCRRELVYSYSKRFNIENLANELEDFYKKIVK